jgi:chemotaxis methyl-accepting protein methylase
VNSGKEARARLMQDPRLMNKAVNALLVGVTEFFRDPWAMEARVDESPGFFKGCRVWSVCCSSGAEAYTLAMMMEARGLLDCGNLLIDLSKASAHKLLSRLYDSLLPEGLLVTGQAETAPEELGFVRLGGYVYRKESQARR